MFDWLQQLVDWFTFSVLGISAKSHLGLAVNFFFYDTIKIFILLFIITFIMGIVNAYLPVDRIRYFLSRKRFSGFEYIFASIFGAITPFCSCSSVPLFIGFVKGGIPLGLTMAFLITSPLVNEVAVAIFLGTFGFKTTMIYVLSGITLGAVGGFILGKLKLEPLLTDWVRNMWEQSKMDHRDFETTKPTLLQRLPAIRREASGIVKSVMPYVLIGIGIGATMHGFVPNEFFEQYIGGNTFLAVPAAVVLGIPIYANAAGVIPVIQVFVAKGIPIGTSLAFMMAVVGLSIPEATLLKKVMSMKLIFIFFGVVTGCIIISGYFFSAIL